MGSTLKIFLLSFVFLMLMPFITLSQITLISPTGDGGFETGTTLGLNGWTAVPDGTNYWAVVTPILPLTATYAGTQGVCVSKNGTVYNYGTGTARTSHFYRDVAIPAGATAITLSFYWKGGGEVGWDRALVYTAPTTVTPVLGAPTSSSTTLTGATLVWTQPTVQSPFAYTLVTITLPNSLAGTTVRLIFTWQNDGSGGTSTGTAIDNISLTCNSPLPCAGMPTGLTTTAVGTTTATIIWTAATPIPASGYDYYYNTTGIAPNSSTTPSGSVGSGITSANLTGLSQSTLYYFWVRANCGSPDGVGNWSSIGSFYTGYCTSIGLSPSYYINNFTTTGGSTNISNTSSGYSANGYSNSTGLLVTQVQGGTISFSASFGLSTTSTFGFGIWVDWNDDLDFSDAGENVFISSVFATSFAGSFNVPAGAVSGNHRMRIVGNYLSSIPVACNSTAISGETEDYTINISAPCVAPANPPNPTSNSPQCSSPGVTISRVGSPPAGETWYWHTSPTGVSTANSGSTFTVTSSGTYYLRSLNSTTGCWSTGNGTITVVVETPPAITVSPASATICPGALQALVVNGGGSSGVLLNEPFIGASLPSGWSTVVGSGDVVGISTTSSAGGTANEAMISGNSQSTNITDILYYGPINTTGLTSLTLQWNNYMNHYSSGWSYGISVQTSTDQLTWHNTSWVTNPVTASIGPGIQTITINTADVGSSTFYLAFTMSGLTFGAFDWYIDNVILTGVSTPASITWSPTTNLYTDAAGTIPYVAGTPATTVYASPTSTTTYTATNTTSAGCTSTSTSVLTIPVVTMTPASATICPGSIQSIVASGGVSANPINVLETFTGATMPAGWTSVIGSGDAIGISTTASAGGTANEAMITGNSQSTNVTDILYYGPINTTGQTSLTLQWNNYLYHYMSTYNYGISVQTSTDHITWHNTSWVTNPVTASIGPGVQSITINTADVGSSTFYLAFKMSGLTFGAYYWYIDNVSITGAAVPSIMTWSPTTNLFTDAAATIPYVSGSNATTVYANPTSTTTYTATTTSNGCTISGTSVISVLSPITPTFPALGPYCVGATPGLLPTSSTNTPAITGTWNPSTISTATAGTTVYTFTPTAGECATPTTMSVTVNSNILPTFTALGPYCVGATP
ncbi:MAG: GEVED domain-containing protein, partial [Bacteroidota bacterium]